MEKKAFIKKVQYKKKQKKKLIKQVKNLKFRKKTKKILKNTRNFKKFLKWQKRKRKKIIQKRGLKKKILLFTKYFFYHFFSSQHTYIIRFCLTRTNLFFICTNFWGDVIFWFTSKQLSFRKYQLKSPYTIDIFYSLLLYFLKLHKIVNFNIFFLGYNRHIKRFIKDLFDLDFTINSIVRYIPLTYNGCKRKHRRRV